MCGITGYATFGGPPPDRGVLPMKHWLRGELKPHLEVPENHSHLPWALMVYQDWRDRWSV